MALKLKLFQIPGGEMTGTPGDNDLMLIEQATGNVSKRIKFSTVRAAIQAGVAGAVASVNGQTGAVVLNSSHITENANLYFTNSRVRSTLLQAINIATVGAVTSADTVLTALGKHEARIVINDAKVSYTDAATLATVLTGLNTASGGAIAAADTVLSAFGKTENRLSSLGSSVSSINAALANKMELYTSNTVDETLFVISDSTDAYFWHVNSTLGFDGTTNPNLISRIGYAETLTNKTVKAPTLEGAVTLTGASAFNGSAQFNSGVYFGGQASFYGGTLFNGGIIATTLTTPLINGRPVLEFNSTGLISSPIFRMTCLGGGVSAAAPICLIETFSAGSISERRFDFGLFNENTQVFSTGAETIMRLGDHAALFDARLATVLTGIDVTTTGTVSAADSVLSAIGKLQATKSSIGGTSSGFIPEGSVTASPGATHWQAVGGGSGTLWVKNSGIGNTGWVELLSI